MRKKKDPVSRWTSIIYRQSSRYADQELYGTMIGYGQQFFLVQIYEEPGISVLDLAKISHFDKGTVTKAVQKLEEHGYIRWEADKQDRRIHHLYTTDKTESIISRVYKIRENWNKILMGDMNPEEVRQAEQLLSKMAENAYQYMADRKKN